ncbi:hypothetical protein, partial [Actinomadura rubrisoli]
MADTRTYIRVHDGMPDHPKVDGLSDKAFRVLVESWCWCSRHLTDGRMPAATWHKRGTPKARRELVDSGLVEQLDDRTVRFHDYLEHQRSAAEVEEMKAARSQGGTYGGHVRWHLNRGITDPECSHCDNSTHGSSHGPTNGKPIAPGSVTDGKPMASSSTDTETEGTTSGSSSRDSVNRHPADRYVRASDNDLDGAIAGLLTEQTGRPCPPDHAAKVRRQLLDGRQVDKPLPYVIRAIRDDPARFLPPPPPTPCLLYPS